jgi:ribose transport system permease protein
VTGLTEGRPLPLAATSRARRFGANAEDLVVTLFPYVLLIAMVAWLGWLQPASLTLRYAQNVVNLSLVLILIAFGQGVVIMTGGIDLSVPGILSLVNTTAATQMGTPERAVLVAVALIALGWVPGAVNGVLVVYGRMQPFIVTLATWFVWAGIAFYILPGPGGEIDATVSTAILSPFLGLSSTTWMLIVLVLFGIWFGRTRLGLSIRAIGSDRASAHHAGVPIEPTEISAYALSSWFAVAAGLLLSLQSMSGEPTIGNNYVLPMITAVVVGGLSLAGGNGSLLGPIVGALVLAYLTGVTFSFRLQPQWNQILQGLLLVLSISSTRLLLYLARTYRERAER